MIFSDKCLNKCNINMEVYLLNLLKYLEECTMEEEEEV
jgi:hypothetical protein